MAINIPIITSLEDKGIKAAQAAFGNFKTAVGDAQGGMNKFKAGSKVALDGVAANAASFAVAGGIAFAKFAMEGVQAFQKLALGAEKFATSTGLAIEDASRFMEVGADIGIPIDAIEGAIGRLNKTIGADPDKVRDLGVDLVYLADGSLDVNATFLNTIERIKGIKDPAEKARVASQLLGKGWQSMSTLIEMGADDLSAALGNVSDAKVIDPSELKKAKEFRDAMDKLKDTVDDLTLAVGEGLVPVLSDLAGIIDKVSSVQDIFKKIPGATWLADHMNMVSPLASAYNLLSTGVKNFFSLFSDEKEVIPVFADDMVLAREDTDDFKTAIKQARLDAILPFNNAVDGMSTALMNADTAWKVLTDSLDQEVALDQAKLKLKELEAAAKLAFGSGAQADIDAYEQQAAEFVGMLSAIAGGMDTISSKEILIRFKTQGPAAAIELADWIFRGAEFGGLSPEDALGLAGISTLPARALGGPVMGGSSYLVGEQGPELFTPSSAGNITPNHALGGGGTINITVTSADPNEVVRALQSYNRNVGKIPVSVQ
jgi:hypothetical protein